MHTNHKTFLQIVYAISIASMALIACPAWAAKDELKDVGHPLSTQSEREIQTKARKKSYRGGRDEEPLTVQLQLPTATRKMGPSEESHPEPAGADD